MSLGTLLKAKRTALGMTLDEVAEAAGMSKSHLHGLECDKCEPGIVLCARLSVALGVPVQAMAVLAAATPAQAAPEAHEGTLDELGEAAELVPKLAASKTNGDILALLLNYRKSVRAQLLDVATGLAGHLGTAQDRIDAALATPSEAVPSPSTADERAAFESWVVKHPRYEGISLRFLALHNAYIEDEVHAAWQAWQARAALSTEPQKAKGPGMRTGASEAGQEPPTHAGSVAPGEVNHGGR